MTEAEASICRRGAEAAAAVGGLLRPSAARLLRGLLRDREAAAAALTELVAGPPELTRGLRCAERWIIRQVLYAALARRALPLGASAVEVLIQAVTDPAWTDSVLAETANE